MSVDKKTIKKLLSPYTIEDYRNAPSHIGPLAFAWKDKPHRLVYDLCNTLQQLMNSNEK